MIDEVMYVSDNELIIYYADGRKMSVCSDDGTALELLEELLGEVPVQDAA